MLGIYRFITSNSRRILIRIQQRRIIITEQRIVCSGVKSIHINQKRLFKEKMFWCVAKAWSL